MTGHIVFNTASEGHDPLVSPQPMSDEARSKFGQRRRTLADIRQIKIAHRQEASPQVDDDEDDLVSEVYRWLGVEFWQRSKPPRIWASAALREFLCPPCSREELVEFMTAFAHAYFRLLETRLEVACVQGLSADAVLSSPSSSGKVEDAISLEFAGVNPVLFANRLSRVRILLDERPMDMNNFMLYEFAGCSVDEIARYLNQSTDVVKNQLELREADIWGPSGRSNA